MGLGDLFRKPVISLVLSQGDAGKPPAPSNVSPYSNLMTRLEIMECKIKQFKKNWKRTFENGNHISTESVLAKPRKKKNICFTQTTSKPCDDLEGCNEISTCHDKKNEYVPEQENKACDKTVNEDDDLMITKREDTQICLADTLTSNYLQSTLALRDENFDSECTILSDSSEESIESLVSNEPVKQLRDNVIKVKKSLGRATNSSPYKRKKNIAKNVQHKRRNSDSDITVNKHDLSAREEQIKFLQSTPDNEISVNAVRSLLNFPYGTQDSRVKLSKHADIEISDEYEEKPILTQNALTYTRINDIRESRKETSDVQTETSSLRRRSDELRSIDDSKIKGKTQEGKYDGIIKLDDRFIQGNENEEIKNYTCSELQEKSYETDNSQEEVQSNDRDYASMDKLNENRDVSSPSQINTFDECKDRTAANQASTKTKFKQRPTINVSSQPQICNVRDRRFGMLRKDSKQIDNTSLISRSQQIVPVNQTVNNGRKQNRKKSENSTAYDKKREKKKILTIIRSLINTPEKSDKEIKNKMRKHSKVNCFQVKKDESKVGGPQSECESEHKDTIDEFQDIQSQQGSLNEEKLSGNLESSVIRVLSANQQNSPVKRESSIVSSSNIERILKKSKQNQYSDEQTELKRVSFLVNNQSDEVLSPSLERSEPFGVKDESKSKLILTEEQVSDEWVSENNNARRVSQSDVEINITYEPSNCTLKTKQIELDKRLSRDEIFDKDNSKLVYCMNTESYNTTNLKLYEFLDLIQRKNVSKIIKELKKDSSSQLKSINKKIKSRSSRSLSAGKFKIPIYIRKITKKNRKCSHQSVSSNSFSSKIFQTSNDSIQNRIFQNGDSLPENIYINSESDLPKGTSIYQSINKLYMNTSNVRTTPLKSRSSENIRTKCANVKNISQNTQTTFSPITPKNTVTTSTTEISQSWKANQNAFKRAKKIPRSNIFTSAEGIFPFSTSKSTSFINSKPCRIMKRNSALTSTTGLCPQTTENFYQNNFKTFKSSRASKNTNMLPNNFLPVSKNINSSSQKLKFKLKNSATSTTDFSSILRVNPSFFMKISKNAVTSTSDFIPNRRKHPQLNPIKPLNAKVDLTSNVTTTDGLQKITRTKPSKTALSSINVRTIPRNNKITSTTELLSKINRSKNMADSNIIKVILKNNTTSTSEFSPIVTRNKPTNSNFRELPRSNKSTSISQLYLIKKVINSEIAVTSETKVIPTACNNGFSLLASRSEVIRNADLSHQNKDVTKNTTELSQEKRITLPNTNLIRNEEAVSKNNVSTSTTQLIPNSVNCATIIKIPPGELNIENSENQVSGYVKANDQCTKSTNQHTRLISEDSLLISKGREMSNDYSKLNTITKNKSTNLQINMSSQTEALSGLNSVLFSECPQQVPRISPLALQSSKVIPEQSIDIIQSIAASHKAVTAATNAVTISENSKVISEDNNRSSVRNNSFCVSQRPDEISQKLKNIRYSALTISENNSLDLFPHCKVVSDQRANSTFISQNTEKAVKTSETISQNSRFFSNDCKEHSQCPTGSPAPQEQQKVMTTPQNISSTNQNTLISQRSSKSPPENCHHQFFTTNFKSYPKGGPDGSKSRSHIIVQCDCCKEICLGIIRESKEF